MNLEGVVISAEYENNTGLKFICSGFGVQHPYGSDGLVLKIVQAKQGFNFKNLFTSDVGKLIIQIFHDSSIIIVLKSSLIPMLSEALPTTLVKKIVLFSTIFGIEPEKFFITGQCIHRKSNQVDSEELTVQVACNIHNFLINSKIFTSWMNYIKGNISNFNIILLNNPFQKLNFQIG